MYNPILKTKNIRAEVANALDVETVMTFIRKYHTSGGEGEQIFPTNHGEVRVCSDDSVIYVDWNNTD